MIRFLSAVMSISLALVGCDSVTKTNDVKTTSPMITTDSDFKSDLAVMAVSSQPVPDFSLPDLYTQKIITNQDLPNKPYLINFWASWCVTCKVENPYLLQLAKQGVPIVGVNYRDETAHAIDDLTMHQNPFVFSVQDKNGWFRDKGLTGIPESFVVDSHQKVRLHLIGEINQERLNRHILPCFQALNQNLSESAIKKACQ